MPNLLGLRCRFDPAYAIPRVHCIQSLRPCEFLGGAAPYLARDRRRQQLPRERLSGASGFVHAEHERLRLLELTGHVAVEREYLLFDLQFPLSRAFAEVDFRVVDPDHVRCVGALEVIAPSGQVLHGPEDGAGDVRLLRIARAEGHRHVPDDTEHEGGAFALVGRLGQPVGVVGGANEAVSGRPLAGQRLVATERAVLLQVLDLLVIGRLVGHHGEALVVIDLRRAADILDHGGVAGLVRERQMHQRREAVWQDERLNLEREVLLRFDGFGNRREVVQVVLHPLHDADGLQFGVALAKVCFARQVQRVRAQALLVDPFMGAAVVGREDQAAVFRGPLVGVLGHRARARDPARIDPEGRVGLFRPVLGPPNKHLPIPGSPEDA